MGNTYLGRAIEKTAKAAAEGIAETLRVGLKSTPPAGYAKGGFINGEELKAQMEAAQGVGVMLEEWPTASWGGGGVVTGDIGETVVTVDIGPEAAYGETPVTEDQKNGTIKGLRLRSKAQGEKNAFLSLENDELKKHIKEIKLQKTRLMDDVGDYTKENRRLVDEVNKGNEYRAKMKETVESLHAQIRAAKEREKAAMSAAVHTEIELERYKRITDALLDKGPF